MNWLELTNLLHAAMQPVRFPDEGPIPHIPTWLRNLTFEEIEQADDAVRYFSQQWEWPFHLPEFSEPNVRYALFFRCYFGMDTAMESGMRGDPFPVEGEDMEAIGKLLVRLLVDDWDQSGLRFADSRWSGKAR